MSAERQPLTFAPTGDPRVDAAIRGLGALAETDLAQHPAVLAEAHDRLRGILGELGSTDRPGQPGPGEPGRRGEQGELGSSFQPGAPRQSGFQPPSVPPRPGAPGSNAPPTGHADGGLPSPPSAGGAPSAGGPRPGAWQRRTGA